MGLSALQRESKSREREREPGYDDTIVPPHFVARVDVEEPAHVEVGRGLLIPGGELSGKHNCRYCTTVV